MNRKNARLVRQYTKALTKQDENFDLKKLAPVIAVFRSNLPKEKAALANSIRAALPHKFEKRRLRAIRLKSESEWNHFRSR